MLKLTLDQVSVLTTQSMHARLQSCFLCAAFLTIKDLAKVRRLTFQASSMWRDIGLELGLQPDALDRIELNYQRVEVCYREMLSEWLRMVNPAPTLETLITTLKQPYVKCAHLVQSVQAEFGLVATPSDTQGSSVAGEDWSGTCITSCCLYVLVAGTSATNITTPELSAEELEGEYNYSLLLIWWGLLIVLT